MQFSTILALAAGASASALLPRLTDSKLLSVSELSILAYAKSGLLSYSLKVTDGTTTAQCVLDIGNSPRDDTSCHNSPEINGFTERICDNEEYAWSLTQWKDGSYDLELVNIADNDTTRLQGVVNLPPNEFLCLEGPEENYVKSYRGPNEFSVTARQVGS